MLCRGKTVIHRIKNVVHIKHKILPFLWVNLIIQLSYFRIQINQLMLKPKTFKIPINLGERDIRISFSIPSVKLLELVYVAVSQTNKKKLSPIVAVSSTKSFN